MPCSYPRCTCSGRPNTKPSACRPTGGRPCSSRPFWIRCAVTMVRPTFSNDLPRWFWIWTKPFWTTAPTRVGRFVTGRPTVLPVGRHGWTKPRPGPFPVFGIIWRRPSVWVCAFIMYRTANAPNGRPPSATSKPWVFLWKVWIPFGYAMKAATNKPGVIPSQTKQRFCNGWVIISRI